MNHYLSGTSLFVKTYKKKLMFRSFWGPSIKIKE